MATYTIRDLEKLSGIKAHTIRIWEKRYGLIEPQRTSTNIREYCDFDLKRLLNVSMLHRNGIKISKIAKLSQDEMADKINHLLQYSSDAESQVESLSIAMIELDEDKFEKILSRTIIQMGFEETAIKVLYPFFIRIGVMWQTGTINPAQEHFVSNLIRQKMIVAIDSRMNSTGEHSKKFLLYLPENELHELGLLFFAYLLKKRGHRTIYLGQSVPLPDVAEVMRIRPVDYIITSFVTSSNPGEISKYLGNLAGTFSDRTVFVSGGQVKNLNGELPQNIRIINSPLEFVHELDLIALN